MQLQFWKKTFSNQIAITNINYNNFLIFFRQYLKIQRSLEKFIDNIDYNRYSNIGKNVLNNIQNNTYILNNYRQYILQGNIDSNK